MENFNDIAVFDSWSDTIPPTDQWDGEPFLRLSLAAVWDRIAPAVPDTLLELRSGLYEARWWSPVPALDVKLLLATEGIIIIGSPYEPFDLPMGCAVRFAFPAPGANERLLSALASKWLPLHSS